MSSSPLDHAPARVLALIVAANGLVDDSELRMLDELAAFRRLGVSREQFVELSKTTLADIGLALSEHAWLRVDDLQFLNELLDAVPDAATRLLVCRLGAAIITADGRITEPERLVYEHVLAHWHISQTMVSQAILKDHSA
jgi:hypothetical protein